MALIKTRQYLSVSFLVQVRSHISYLRLRCGHYEASRMTHLSVWRTGSSIRLHVRGVRPNSSRPTGQRDACGCLIGWGGGSEFALGAGFGAQVVLFAVHFHGGYILSA